MSAMNPYPPHGSSPSPSLGGEAGPTPGQNSPSQTASPTPLTQEGTGAASYAPQFSHAPAVTPHATPPAYETRAPQPPQVQPPVPAVRRPAVGVTMIGGYPVPEALQYDHSFLSQPEVVQVYMLQVIHEGRLAVTQPTIVSQTVRRTVRLFNGQWEKLSELVESCQPFEEDRRRSITENTFLRQMVSLYLGMVAHYMDLSEVATEDALRREMVKAFQRAAQASLTRME